MAAVLMHPKDYNIANLLFNADSQRRFILMAHDDLDSLMEMGVTHPPDVIWMRPSSDDHSAAAPTDTKQPKTIPFEKAVASSDDQEDYTTIEYNIPRIKLALKWSTQQPIAHVLTWMVISILYVSPEARRQVSRHTEKGISERFFHEFEERMSYWLMGCVISPPKKKGQRPTEKKVVYPALTPTQIVAEMYLFYNDLVSSTIVAQGH